MPREPASLTTDFALEGEPVWADHDDAEDLTNGSAPGPSTPAAPMRAVANRPPVGVGPPADGARATTLAPEPRPSQRRQPRRGAPVRPVPARPDTDGRVAPWPVERRQRTGDEVAPELEPPRPAGRRGRRVKRIVRRVDLWSILKLSLVLYVCLYAATLMAVAGLWGFINSAGLINRFESFMKDVGFDKFQFHGLEMFRAVVAGGAILVLASALLTVIAFGLFNAVSELTGGLRLTVIEEEPSVRLSRHQRKEANRAERAADHQPGSDL